MNAGSYRIVDVFAEQSFGGNQLAVVFIDGTEPDGRLQAVAREFNFSETVFLPADLDVDGGKDEVPVRIFTPLEELPFAGHPTLGASWVVGQITGARDITLLEKIGAVHTWFAPDSPDTVWMQQHSPTFGQEISLAEAATILSIGVSDLLPDSPARCVSTGVEFLIVPLAGRGAVSRARLNTQELSRVFPDDAPPVFLFAQEAQEASHDLSARMYAPHLGIAEDSATGSATGCLAAYLLETGLIGSPVEVALEQGYDMGRPSVLHINASVVDGEPRLCVGGQVRPFAEGIIPGWGETLD